MADAAAVGELVDEDMSRTRGEGGVSVEGRQTCVGHL